MSSGYRVRIGPILVPANVSDELRHELEGARDEAEAKGRSYPRVAATRVWDVIMGLPDAARASTVRRLGGDARLVEMASEMMQGDAWNPTDAWLAAADQIATRIEARIEACVDAGTEDQVEMLVQMLTWAFAVDPIA